MFDSKGNLIKVYDHRKDVILERRIKELIPEIVAAQINIDFEFEAIKAQTIIARTLLIRKAKLFGGEGCKLHPDADICLKGHCTQWISKEELRDKWKDNFNSNWEKLIRAEEETDKIILTFNNKVIDPKFHFSCGGSTENSENVENHQVVYLRKVLCEYCVEKPGWENTKDITLDEIIKLLDVKVNKISPFHGSNISGIIEELERDEHGRVNKIKIGDKIFKGTELMEGLGLDSTRGIYN